MGFGKKAVHPGDILHEVEHCDSWLVFRECDTEATPKQVTPLDACELFMLTRCDEDLYAPSDKEYEEMVIV